jgi:hypothetical protein
MLYREERIDGWHASNVKAGGHLLFELLECNVVCSDLYVLNVKRSGSALVVLLRAHRT